MQLQVGDCVRVDFTQERQQQCWFGKVTSRRATARGRHDYVNVSYSHWSGPLGILAFRDKQKKTIFTCGRLPTIIIGIEVTAIYRVDPKQLCEQLIPVSVAVPSPATPVAALCVPDVSLLVPVEALTTPTDVPKDDIDEDVDEEETDEDEDDEQPDWLDDVVSLAAPHLNPQVQAAIASTLAGQGPGGEQGSASALCTAPTTLGQLKALLRRPPARIPKICEDGLAKTTRKGHRNWLARLLNTPTALEHLTVSEGIISFLTTQFMLKTWRATTLVKYFGTIQGVLIALPLYRMGAPSIRISECQLWRAAVRAATIRSRMQGIVPPMPMTYEQMEMAVRLESSLPVRALLIVAWMTCGRVGCVLSVAKGELRLNHQTQTISVTFMRGKAAKMRCPVTVDSGKLPSKWWELLVKWESTRHRMIFPEDGSCSRKVILEALRRVATGLESRSIRRGALQHLAELKVDEVTLMRFSGHASVLMLRRYLLWGAVTVANQVACAEAARQHAPSVESQLDLDDYLPMGQP